jgi:hypothetical protein
VGDSSKGLIAIQNDLVDAKTNLNSNGNIQAHASDICNSAAIRLLGGNLPCG